MRFVIDAMRKIASDVIGTQAAGSR